MSRDAMAWTYLLLAGACEIVATTVFRYAEGFTKLGPSVASVAIGLLSFYLLNRSLAGLPLGTAYAVWTGIGAVGTVIMGIILFGEAATVTRLMCMGLIVAGIAGLKFL